MKKNFSIQKNKKGFTFVEVMIVMFVLVGVMMAATGIFSSMTKSYRKAALTQQDLEQAQFALNLMSKVLRTSFIKVPSAAASNATDIIVYDKSQGRCVRFQFTGNKLRKVSVTPTGTNDKERMQNCDSGTSGIDSLTEVTNTYVGAGYFKLVPTVVNSDDEVVSLGKVTISMSICPASGCAASLPVMIQSTVSHRIYKEIAP